ncbi:uncharacterized protein LOC111711535 [Eurytemora carolleeae]|uniref:uncharacterized protein LOC111711535 n=1 Tax=Eurytemora carolleeae TaxID=1294199 RepID=UPI000C76576F|nr:uncharacterized protein LOC111711535 [Eurytemora carolleeae]|eukprot:XP_023341683.1 uncharacterized protein LOC111711535 [Eurytemora affinis]
MNGINQYVGYPSFVVLENSVPMPISQVRAECNNASYNSFIKYSVEGSKTFFADEDTGEIYAVNPAGGSRMDSICSESEMNCRVVVKATLNSVSKIITVYVTSVSVEYILVVKSDENPETVLKNLNIIQEDIWFRLMNLQLENKSERQDGFRNRMFLTAHKMLDTSSGFLTYSEAAIIARNVSGVTIEISEGSDDIFIHDTVDEEEDSNTAVLVIALLLTFLLLGILIYILIINRRPIQKIIRKKMKSRNENAPKIDRLEDVQEPTLNRNPMTSQVAIGSKDIYGVPAVGGATQHGLNREISYELERRLDVKVGHNADVFKSKPDSALPTQGKPVSKPSPPVQGKPVPEPPRKAVTAPAPPKKPVPSVPEPTYTLDGVRFNEKAEVVEVALNKRKDSSSSGTSDSSSSSTSSSDGSDESSSSDEAVTAI